LDQLRAMRLFVAVADRGGFAAAARGLGVSAPTVSRAIEALEDRLGVKLLRRTTRSISLTPEGAAYLDTSRSVLAQIDEADRGMAGAAEVPRGTLRLTAPVQFGKLHVAPLVFDFLAQHPDVSVRLILLDRRVNIVEEGFDFAFRIGHLGDRALVGASLGRVRCIVCAAPGYLDRRGRPQRPQDLAGHDLTELSAMGAFGTIWRFRDRGGRDFDLKLAPQLVVNTTDVALAAAIAGAGITRVLHYQAADAIAAGRLEILLADFERPPVPVSLVLAAARPSTAAIRSFLAMTKARFHLQEDASFVAREDGV